MKSDTIAAIATAVSDSGIGIIRISGENAIEVADRVYRSKNNKKRLLNVKAIRFIMDLYMMAMSWWMK